MNLSGVTVIRVPFHRECFYVTGTLLWWEQVFFLVDTAHNVQTSVLASILASDGDGDA